MYFDTHAHLDQAEFDTDRDAVLARAWQAGVETVITLGVGAKSSAASVSLAAQYARRAGSTAVYAAVGIQPNYCAEAQPGDWDHIVALAGKPGVVAIGETGLDRHWDFTPFAMQQDYFDRHLRLAAERGLPFVVHTRDCDADALGMLRAARQRGPLRGVMHSFTGAQETAAECVELGLYISFAGMVTFKKSDALRAVAKSVSLNRILIETDSPYLSPHPHRGQKRNEPALVVHTAACLAELLGLRTAEFARQTTANARALFDRAV